MACSRSLAAQDGWLDALLDLNLAKEFWLIFYAIGHGLGRFDPLKLMIRCVMLDAYTLQLDDDVLAAARVLARQRRRSVGDVISDLARQALSRSKDGGSQNVLERRSGLPQLPVTTSGGVVDLELVNQLRDEDS